MKRIVLILTAWLIIGCDTQPSTYVYSPTQSPAAVIENAPVVDHAAESLLAGGTQTAVADIRKSTAVAIEATAQSAHVQQTAVSSYATATQQTSIAGTNQAIAQATSAIATETAIYQPISVQQTSDAQMVINQRASTSSTATAVSMSLQIDQDIAMVERSNVLWIMFEIFLAGILLSGFVFTIRKALMSGRPVDAVFDDEGNVVAFDGRMLQESRTRRTGRTTVIPHVADVIPDPPVNNLRSTTWHVNNESRTINVSDAKGIDKRHWHRFAVALLIEEVNFSRNDITDETWLSQPIYNSLFESMTEDEMIGQEGEDKLNVKGYQYLFDFLSADEQERVKLPHPDNASPVYAYGN